jgi:hypothetical protein
MHSSHTTLKLVPNLTIFTFDPAPFLHTAHWTALFFDSWVFTSSGVIINVTVRGEYLKKNSHQLNFCINS